MHYPVNVFVGKIRDYAGSRPSAIGKIQVDGELQLGDLGLDGDEQAEKKITAGRTARCATIRANTMPTGSVNSPAGRSVLRPGVRRKPLHHRAYRAKRLYRRYLSLGRGADPGHPAAIAVLQAQLSFCDQ
jgi:hypothetical protein